MSSGYPEKRVLAIDPISRGFGFAVLEGPQEILDWGVKHAEENKDNKCREMTGELIAQYQPDMIVLEDWSGKGSRRCQRVGKLIEAVRALAASIHIPTRCFSRDKVKQSFSSQHAVTKYRIAIAIARQLPELSPRLPRFRKPWMSEDERMAIFDAVSFALTFYYFGSRRRGLAPITQ